MKCKFCETEFEEREGFNSVVEYTMENWSGYKKGPHWAAYWAVAPGSRRPEFDHPLHVCRSGVADEAAE